MYVYTMYTRITTPTKFFHNIPVHCTWGVGMTDKYRMKQNKSLLVITKLISRIIRQARPRLPHPITPTNPMSVIILTSCLSS